MCWKVSSSKLDAGWARLGASVAAAGSVDDGLHSDGGCVFVLVDRVELPASGPGLWRWRPLK